jgi:hypothetical protein
VYLRSPRGAVASVPTFKPGSYTSCSALPSELLSPLPHLELRRRTFVMSPGIYKLRQSNRIPLSTWVRAHCSGVALPVANLVRS